MKIRLFLVCESAVIDVKTSSLSIFNIFEEINSQGFPLFIPKIAVVSAIERTENEDKTPEFNLQITQEKKNLLNKTFTINFQNKMRARQIIELHGFTITNPGNLLFRLNLEGKKLAEYRLYVKASPGPKEVST